MNAAHNQRFHTPHAGNGRSRGNRKDTLARRLIRRLSGRLTRRLARRLSRRLLKTKLGPKRHLTGCHDVTSDRWSRSFVGIRSFRFQRFSHIGELSLCMTRFLRISEVTFQHEKFYKSPAGLIPSWLYRVLGESGIRTTSRTIQSMITRCVTDCRNNRWRRNHESGWCRGRGLSVSR